MKNIIVFALAAVIFTPDVCLSQNEETTMTKQWFSTEECSSLDIKKYKSIAVHQVGSSITINDSRVDKPLLERKVSSITINDSKVVKSIMERIKNIPADGNLMKSFGPDVEIIELIFHCANETTQKVEIYQQRFKTPSTGFNAGKNETESLLYSDIDALLFPDFEKRILKIRNVVLKFRDFSLTYLGETNSEPAPVTSSWTTNRFRIKDNNNNEQIVDIASGQLSPQPYNFDIGQVGFTLLTYQTEMKDRLYPDYFQVVNRNH